MKHLFEYLINRKLTAKDANKHRCKLQLLKNDDIATLFAKCVYLAFDGKLDPDNFKYSEAQTNYLANYSAELGNLYNNDVKNKLIELLKQCKRFQPSLKGGAFNVYIRYVTAYDGSLSRYYGYDDFIQLDDYSNKGLDNPKLVLGEPSYEKYKELF